MNVNNPQQSADIERDPGRSGLDEEEFDIRDLFMKLNRRRGAIAGIFLLVMVITGLNLYQATPQYTAKTQLSLDLRKSRVVDIEDVLSGVSADASVIGTELDILQSSTLLEKVVERLRLDRDPEFNPALRENGGQPPLKRFRAWLGTLWFLESDAVEKPDPGDKEQRLKQAIVRQIQGNLNLEHRRQSYTINLSYTSQSPEWAAAIANTLAELYLTDQLEAKFEATRRANEWLAERLGNIRREVQQAEQAVKQVREQSDMIQAGGSTILEQQISDVNTQLIQARVKSSRAEARLERAREVIDHPSGIRSLGEALGSRSIQQLRSEETDLRRQKAELSQRYGPRHPQMIQIEAEMIDLQKKHKEEANLIIESLVNEVQLARAEEASLMQSLNHLRDEAGQAMEAELELRELQRLADSSRTLYQNFLNRFQETREQGTLHRPDARIISPAEVPRSASHPRKKRTLAMGMAAGLMFGVMGAFLLENLDRGFRTGEQLERSTGLPLLGTVPLLHRSQGEPLEYVIKKPFSPMAESLRAIRTALHLSNVDQPPEIIMITSALPKEGKTSISISLGHLSAGAGIRTLVVDADLRRPTLSSHFPNSSPSARLEDVLEGKAEIHEAVVQDRESGLNLLMAHGKVSTVREMLGSRLMQDLLESLREEYDLIILDTPPVLGISDVWNLARSVDAVAFIVRWAETPRDTVQMALHQMNQLGIRVNGLVFSMVNIRQQKKYGYGGYGYYYGKYKNYYDE